mmetsp:Transcript_23429/g.60273  ORF Transcript_23429/g.60273 Transcript_23429/m.60273 type:complete len:337 (-) Transcript_23429:495-1505(-)
MRFCFMACLVGGTGSVGEERVWTAGVLVAVARDHAHNVLGAVSVFVDASVQPCALEAGALRAADRVTCHPDDEAVIARRSQSARRLLASEHGHLVVQEHQAVLLAFVKDETKRLLPVHYRLKRHVALAEDAHLERFAQHAIVLDVQNTKVWREREGAFALLCLQPGGLFVRTRHLLWTRLAQLELHGACGPMAAPCRGERERRAVVQLENVPRDHEAEPRAASPLQLPLSHLRERLAVVERVHLARGEAHPGVHHTHAHGSVIAIATDAHAHGDAPTALGELDRVGHHIVDALLQASAIPHVHRAVCKYRTLDPLCNERDPLLLRPSPKCAHCLVE